jgi:ABC-type uncharacterized transport system ATPase subunit
VTALADVDLDVHAGEIHAILGENGAGKSTLMNAIYGLVRLDAGSIELCGRTVRLDSPTAARRAGIGMVHQEFALVDEFSVAENLALALSPPNAIAHAPDHIASAARELASRVGLSLGDLDARVGDLPVGVRQRIEILKSLAGRTDVLILDEPTAVLTPAEAEQLFTVLQQLREHGTAVLFITHRLREVVAIADRITVMRRGRVVARVLPNDVDEARLAHLMVGDMPARPGRAEQPPSFSEHEIPQLCIEHVRVIGRENRMVIDDLTLAVRRKEIFGIAGVDGNGQSELFEVLTGLRRPIDGIVRVAGEPIHKFEPAAMASAGVGQIPPDRQRQGAVLPMSIRDNAALHAMLLRRLARGPFLSSATLDRFARDLLRSYAIKAENLSNPVGNLSGGNLQRLVVARALALNPRLLVAFNPTRGLDVAAANTVFAALHDVTRRGAAVVLISTDLDEVLEVSDRIAVIQHGHLSEPLLPPFSSQRLGLMLAGVSSEAG